MVHTRMVYMARLLLALSIVLAGMFPMSFSSRCVADDLDSAFNKASGKTGSEFRDAYRELFALIDSRTTNQEGVDEVTAFLQSRLRSVGWQARNLAATALMRMGDPLKFEQLRLLFALGGGPEILVERDGKLFVALNEQTRKQIRSVLKSSREWPDFFVFTIGAGDLPGDAEIEIERSAIPLINHVMQESIDYGHFAKTAFAKAMVAFQVFKEPDTAGSILFHAAQVQALDSSIESTLFDLGPQIIPALHEEMKLAGSEDYYRRSIAQKAIRLIGRFADASSLAPLLEQKRVCNAGGPGVHDETIALLCDSISRIDRTNGASFLFEELTSGRFEKGRGRRDLRHYFPIRRSLIAMGDVAAKEMEQRLADETDLTKRAIARGVLFEINNTNVCRDFYTRCLPRGYRNRDQRERDGGLRSDNKKEEPLWITGQNAVGGYNNRVASGPNPLVLEFAVQGRIPRLLKLLQTGEPDALTFELLAEMLVDPDTLEPFFDETFFPIAHHCVAVDEGAERAFAAFLAANQNHQLNERTIDLITESAMQIGGDDVPEFLFKLADAIPQEDEHYGEFASQVNDLKKLALMWEENSGAIDAIMSAERMEHRLSAARILARRKDLRAIEPIFLMRCKMPEWRNVQTEFLREDGVLKISRPVPERTGKGTGAEDSPLDRAYGLQGGAPSALYTWLNEGGVDDTIVAYGRDALPAIDDAAMKSDSPFAALLADVLRLRIERPELDERFFSAFDQRWPNEGNRGGMRYEDNVEAGRMIADVAGEDSIPLLEAAIIWRRPGTGQGLFALLHFQREGNDLSALRVLKLK